ncbi:hypothetical protein N9383_06880 [Granulosicoccus sp.]|nr:hypothetical protein [Granulosicoccus sp.]
MNTPPLLKSSGAWSLEQLLAVHGFCQQIGKMVWQHHSETLIGYLSKQGRSQRFYWPEPPAQTNLSLPFNEGMEF